jgi:2-polyprenyl-6-methoxyphenol hydroxylase-like FAD-dependent oxidoreductase
MALQEKANGATMQRSTEVLVAGGGPVGLSAAIELAQRGISCLVIEPRTSVSWARPRCKTINVRTMEHLRRWGIAERLRARAPLATSWSQEVVFCTSLVGDELSRFSGVFGLTAHGDRSPELGQQAPQYLLEELLREVVDELSPCELLTGLRVVDVEQTGGEAKVTVEDQTGHRSVISAEYVLGCDGPRSAVREAIGSSYAGELALRPNFGMVFNAPELWQHVRHGPAVQYWIVNQTAPALIGPVDLVGTWWMIAIGVDRETGERDARQIIEGAVGTSVPLEILSNDPWTARMQLVDRARRGRVFLAGDAAHLNPPFGGHGLNTGIGDAADLGWKLAAMLDGWGGPALLDSYEAERRPIHRRVIDEAAANMSVLPTELLGKDIERDDAAGEQARLLLGARIKETKTAEFHALDLVLGASYDESPIIVPDTAETRPWDGHTQAARPGARLPHAWLSPRRSLYDELGYGLTLLLLAATDAAALETARRACRARGVPLSVLDLTELDLRAPYGADLLLVRPDQHIAWRGDRLPDDPMTVIDQVRGASTATRLETTSRHQPIDN